MQTHIRDSFNSATVKNIFEDHREREREKRVQQSKFITKLYCIFMPNLFILKFVAKCAKIYARLNDREVVHNFLAIKPTHVSVSFFLLNHK